MAARTISAELNVTHSFLISQLAKGFRLTIERDASAKLLIASLDYHTVKMAQAEGLDSLLMDLDREIGCHAEKKKGKAGRPRIKDEFSKLPVSSSRRSQLRNMQKGLCIYCSKPRVTGRMCLGHAVKTREDQRKRKHCGKRNKGARSYVLQQEVLTPNLL